MGGGAAADVESLQPEVNGGGDKALVAKEVNGQVVVETVEVKKGKQDESVEDVVKKSGGSVSIFKLFKFADPFDYLLIFLGTVGAATHGCSLPVFFLFFGKLLDGFGANANDPDKTANVVGHV
jgi:ATP-binding cassette subfamily B (MDR/TAP) protein 1